jgi:alkanesulfonate monooxygenase SsuD/methylene tetrahydromethanopterin reductase-like flavin-dependent oxidoreductase (luciferase family)
MIVGSPATVKAGVEEMVRAHGADEFMAVTIVWSHEARVRSYELLADAFAL